MTRLKMDWAGHQPLQQGDEWKKTFRTLLLLGLFKFLVIDDIGRPSHIALFILYWMYLMFLLVRVRSFVRNRDGIPDGEYCYEDFCMAFWLPCCTVSQLARQTANYDIEIGYFLTQDGLSPPDPVTTSNYDDVVYRDESMIV